MLAELESLGKTTDYVRKEDTPTTSVSSLVMIS